MNRVDAARLDALTEAARACPRQRLNDNLHAGAEDTVQRLCIAIEPGSYVRPHRHDAGRFELFVALRGRLVMLTFADDGTVLSRDEMTPEGALPVVEIPGGTWHAVAALEPGSLFLEVKQGPYRPLDDKNFAAWAPVEGVDEAVRMADWLAQAQPGERPSVLSE